MGLWKIIGIGTMNGTWSTSDELESGTLTGWFFYRMASYLYRDIHGLFIGTLTYGSDRVTENIRGDFTVFGPENYGGSDWRTPSITHGWAKRRSPKI
jgi:hypothetical protein